MANGAGSDDSIEKIKSQEFGALWLADRIDQDVGLAGLIDSVIPKGTKETGPSVGEYFLYALFNRMVDACSKRPLSDWYDDTAIQHIRPVAVYELTSQRYWEKCGRVDENDLQKIADLFSGNWQNWNRHHRIAFCLTPPITSPSWPVIPSRNFAVAVTTRREDIGCGKLGWLCWFPGITRCLNIDCPCLCRGPSLSHSLFLCRHPAPPPAGSHHVSGRETLLNRA